VGCLRPGLVRHGYVAFVIDAYSRRILGWRAAISMRASLVFDALEQAVGTRSLDGVADLSGVVGHPTFRRPSAR
jgi:putative transposase